LYLQATIRRDQPLPHSASSPTRYVKIGVETNEELSSEDLVKPDP
jgi:hypothetical protein